MCNTAKCELLFILDTGHQFQALKKMTACEKTEGKGLLPIKGEERKHDQYEGGARAGRPKTNCVGQGEGTVAGWTSTESLPVRSLAPLSWLSQLKDALLGKWLAVGLTALPWCTPAGQTHSGPGILPIICFCLPVPLRSSA